MENYVIGIDYGTDSCRAVITDTKDGKELASEVFYYPRWKQGLYCEPQKFQYRQHPLDYTEGLVNTVNACVKKVPENVRLNIRGLSIDTTGSTPVAVDKDGTPLSLLPEFAENPNAMFILWKDHTATKEADEINAAASRSAVDYTKYIGGIYSSEWFFAKILHTLREDEAVREKAYSWVEHCDWLTNMLAGTEKPEKLMRSRCAAGHKAMWNAEFNGLPPESFFLDIDPLLAGLRERLFEETYPSDKAIGTITKEWADKLNLPENVKVGVGAFDCHMGAVGGNICEGAIVKVMGTSTCDIIVESPEKMQGVLVGGICGQVDGSVIPGMIGMEAGQSAFGDVYAWFKRLISWPLSLIPSEKINEAEIAAISDSILYELEKQAVLIDPRENELLSVDWQNGRRTPYANQNLKGAITGLTLSSDAPRIYRSLLEATAFGSKAIIDRFTESGINITHAIAIGGVAKKSPLNMQICADVFNMPVKVCKSEQAVALGASIFAAVAGGVYATVEEAQKNMAGETERTYYPNPEMVEVYKPMYQKYLKLGKFIENE